MKRYSKKQFNMIKSYLCNRGATMIAALVVMTILIAFTFSLTLVAYTLYASQNKNNVSMKCAEAANTLSDALGDEITYIDEANNRFPEYDSYLYRYLRYNICQSRTWPYYDPKDTTNHGKDKAFRYFDLYHNTSKVLYDENGEPVTVTDDSGNEAVQNIDNVEGMPGNVEVCMYWMPPEGMTVTSVNDITSRRGIRLFIEVTCESASQTYTTKREYILDVKNYQVDTDPLDRSRHNYLLSKSTDTAINPCLLDPEDVTDPIHHNEMWIWSKYPSEE